MNTHHIPPLFYFPENNLIAQTPYPRDETDKLVAHMDKKNDPMANEIIKRFNGYEELLGALKMFFETAHVEVRGHHSIYSVVGNSDACLAMRTAISKAEVK